MSSRYVETTPAARPDTAQNARDALSAALASMPKAQVRRVYETSDEEAAQAGRGGAFKKLKTGKGWAADGSARDTNPTEALRTIPESHAEESLATADDGPCSDAQEAMPEPTGSPQMSKPKMQLLKNRMRRNSKTQLLSNSNGPGTEHSPDATLNEPLADRKAAAQAAIHAVAGRAKDKQAAKDKPKPKPKGKPKSSQSLGNRSAFLSYQGQGAKGAEPADLPTAERDTNPKGRPSYDGSRPAPDQAAQVLHALQQRQVWWQGKVRHKMGSSAVDLFHLAATIPAELAEQFPPALYVTELKHRSEVVLTEHMWVKCSARSLTEKQLAKLHLLTDNKLVAVIRLQHCELILVPDMDPASSSIRTAGFLLADQIYT